MSGSLDCRMDTLPAQCFQQSGGKPELRHRFAAGEGDSPARMPEVRNVTAHLFHHLPDRHIPADPFDGPGRTGVGTTRTSPAPLASKRRIPQRSARIAVRTRFVAYSAPDTARTVEQQFVRRTLRFGIVAPGATQRTPFQKHRGTYPRSVVGTKTLYVENTPRHPTAAISRPSTIVPTVRA